MSTKLEIIVVCSVFVYVRAFIGADIYVREMQSLTIDDFLERFEAPNFGANEW